MDERLRRAAALVYVADLDRPTCGDEDAHHLVDVLRLRRGEEVAAGDGAGAWRPCTLAAVERSRQPRPDRVVLEPAGPVTVEPTAPRVGVVGFALQKGDRPEWTVQKLTELGVDRVVPLLTERTVVRLDGGGRRRRGERLRRVAREAAAQSRRLRLAQVEDPVPLPEALSSLRRDHRVGFAEPGGGGLDRCDAVLVGPEGGWAPGELASAERRVGLGPLVLRAETAALLAAVLLGAERFPRAGGHANE